LQTSMITVKVRNTEHIQLHILFLSQIYGCPATEIIVQVATLRTDHLWHVFWGGF
jgi:hypothetical protein